MEVSLTNSEATQSQLEREPNASLAKFLTAEHLRRLSHPSTAVALKGALSCHHVWDGYTPFTG